MQRFADCQLLTTGLAAGLSTTLMTGRLIIGWHITGPAAARGSSGLG
eukprot:CAMPEP_0204520788 /NCGR_PEP_ID=MMETSP0661-20131031/5447_1 /ASSEMBLY_ACC=CAM_ASM_000606 /TAXON_ID=109239 /ORGANISM="Alexandrium margalefi, Strain AMGDE01CS-322" /LENGTH=46 /DNA_ID= /DNA_START= /DNA_END= /DNA_ORIENTATION=